MWVQMHVDEFLLTLEEVIVVLKDSAGERSLSLWIGPEDAASIVVGIRNPQPRLSLTHDLITHFLQRLDIQVERVVINDLVDNVYLALIHLGDKSEVFTLDARPSDAIGLAVRNNAPIFVKEELLFLSPKGDLGLNLSLE